MSHEPQEYVTLDGSVVRELVRPETTGSRHLSVATARVAPGQRTHPHRHLTSEEAYYVLRGEGSVTVGSKTTRVTAGGAVLIPVGTVHWAVAEGTEPLLLVCLCAPPYQHEDTQLSPAD